MADAPAVRFEHVVKSFGALRAVDDLSFTIPRGAIYGFLGQNGAGKTTSLRMLVGILRPDGGRCDVLGASDPTTVRAQLGYLPEEKGLYRKMRVVEYIAYIAGLKGMDRRAARGRALALLERYGLGDRAWRTCEGLSKGMGQKVQLLATIAHAPALLVLDEPFSGLDPVNVQAMFDAIRDARQAGQTVLFSTHIMEHAEKLCDAVLMIHRGRKRFDGPIGAVTAGVRTVRLEFEGDGAFLRDLPGVAQANLFGQSAELELRPGADAAGILDACRTRLQLRLFDRREPSLQELFIRTVREAEAEATRVA